MKIEDYIQVTQKAKYSGQNMEWTEGLLRIEKVKKDTTLYHSSDTKVSKFRAKQTCFHEGYAIRGHVYALIIPAGTEVERYQGGEVRVELKEGMELRYLGQMICNYEFVRPGVVKEIARYTGILEEYLRKETKHWETV